MAVRSWQANWAEVSTFFDYPAEIRRIIYTTNSCLLYTSDAADERSSVDLGGRRIIKKKKYRQSSCSRQRQIHNEAYEKTSNETHKK